MSYKITPKKKAKKFIEKQNPKERELLLKAICKLPEGNDIIPLKGRPGFRLRLGDYRVIFLRDDIQHEITVINIDNRGDVYK